MTRTRTRTRLRLGQPRLRGNLKGPPWTPPESTWECQPLGRGYNVNLDGSAFVEVAGSTIGSPEFPWDGLSIEHISSSPKLIGGPEDIYPWAGPDGVSHQGPIPALAVGCVDNIPYTLEVEGDTDSFKISVTMADFSPSSGTSWWHAVWFLYDEDHEYVGRSSPASIGSTYVSFGALWEWEWGMRAAFPTDPVKYAVLVIIPEYYGDYRWRPESLTIEQLIAL